jgi:hypothetical protein
VLEARVVQARVPQFEVPTLSSIAASHHGRLNQKNGAWSYLRYKRASGATAATGGRVGTPKRADPRPVPGRSGATDNRSAPASISPPPSPPWNSGIAVAHPSLRAMLAIALWPVKRLAYPNLMNPR